MDTDEFYRSARWHAPHPLRPKEPLCGTVGEDGRPTHRVSTQLKTTCKRCLKRIAKATEDTPMSTETDRLMELAEAKSSADAALKSIDRYINTVEDDAWARSELAKAVQAKTAADAALRTALEALETRAELAEQAHVCAAEERDHLRAALAAREEAWQARAALSDPAPAPLEVRQGLTWQPIETAPMDGYMLVHEDTAIRALLRINGVWHKAGYPAIISHPWGDVIVGDDAKRILPPGYRLELCDGCCESPTHWMPLPDPPGGIGQSTDSREGEA